MEIPLPCPPGQRTIAGVSEPTRWTTATVHPDMWVDPQDDPRNNDGPGPDGELATYQDYLTSYRFTLLMKCDGLDAAQLARRSVPPSTLSLLGLLRHVAHAERGWSGWLGDPRPPLHPGDSAFEGAVADPEVVEAARADLAVEQTACDALFEGRDLAERIEGGASIRELWVHRIEEYARHCGHADLLRECIDGRVGQ